MWLRHFSVLLTFLLCQKTALSQEPVPDISAQINQLLVNSKSVVESLPDSALHEANRAFQLSQQYQLDLLSAKSRIAISTAYSYLADYDAAIENSFRALEYAEKQADTLMQLDACNNLGIDFMYQGDYGASRGYLERVLKLSQLVGDTLRWGHALNNLGLIVSYEGGDPEEEKKFYEQAMKLFQQLDEQEGYANTLLNLGTVFTEGKDFQKADYYLQQALAIFKSIDFASGIEQTLQSIAENELGRSNFAKALTITDEALAVAKTNGVLQDLPFIYHLYMRIYAAKGDFVRAYQWQERFHSAQDSIFNSEKSLQIQELQTRYETERKQSEIEHLQLENQLQQADLRNSRNTIIAMSIGTALLVLIVVLVFVFRARKKRMELEEQELQIEALQQRVMELMTNKQPAELMEIQALNDRLHHDLTQREYEILTLSLQHKTNAEIAEQLYIAVSTVKFHLRNTYTKLGVNNRKEALQYVVKKS